MCVVETVCAIDFAYDGKLHQAQSHNNAGGSEREREGEKGALRRRLTRKNRLGGMPHLE